MLLALVVLATTAKAATFVVTTTADSGAGSLRQAITDANALAGTDSITFAIPTADVPQIAPVTNLPALSTAIVLDGTTQSPAGRVELSGTTTIGLQLTGNGSTVRGFVVHGFTSIGIKVAGTGSHVVEGNYVGTDVAGTSGASAGATGVDVTSGSNRIGGFTAATGNLISGNANGIDLHGAGAASNQIVGNWIGTDVTGNAALPNSGIGITAFVAGGNTIGGTAAGAGNVIAGNGSDGIALSSSDDFVVKSNHIGVGADGATPVPNGRHGVRLLNTSAGATIGGDGPNHIAYNVGTGVIVASNGGARNLVSANSIHDNGGPGIDIGSVGITPNDALDVDAGANLLQNFPVLDVFTTGTEATGVLDSGASASFTIEIFASSACDTSGAGEGTALVASLPVTTDLLGHAAFTASLSRTVDAATEFLTATATDALGNTSEFSACMPTPTTTTTTTTTTSTTKAPTTSTTSSTSTTAVPTTSSTSTSAAPTTSTSTTVPTTTSTATPTTSSTSSTAIPTTSSTSTSTLEPDSTTSTTEPASTTTSTTLAAVTTTSSTLAPTTTSTTIGDTTTSTEPEEPTTTSTTLAASTTTSTTLPPSTTSTTNPDATTTTSTDVPTTTTSTTLLDTTTTSSTAPDTTTTSTTDVPSTTTTSTTDASTTTTSSSTSTTAPTTSTTPVTTTSTSSTALVPTTTSSTLPPCSGDGCPSGCGSDVAFDSLRCRLAGFTTEVGATPELVPMRPVLDRHLGRARTLLDGADDRCRVAKRGPAKHRLRMMRKRLAAVGRLLGSAHTRQAVPDDVARALRAQLLLLATDTRTLGRSLVCP